MKSFKQLSAILSLATLLLFFSQATQAQSLLTDGAEWHYTGLYYLTGQVIPLRHYIDGDTIIQNKLCKKYFRSHLNCDGRPPSEFMYEEDDKLYYFEEEEDRFKILYDYDVSVGDTIAIEHWSPFNGSIDSVFHIKIDSITDFEYDTITLRKIHYTTDAYEGNNFVFDPVYADAYIEGIGAFTNFFIFHYTLCDALYCTELRCFNHPDYGEIKFVDYACDSSSIDVNTEELSINYNISLFPNPVTETLIIESNASLKIGTIAIYNVTGKKILERKINLSEGSSQNIDVEQLKSGTYVIAISDEKNDLLFSQKIIKD